MRADVLALTADALAALTNRGLVKRAAREVEAAPPEVSEDPDGTLRGACPDGPAPVLPSGGLERATCTCGAIGTCRHVLALILAYQRTNPPPAAPTALAAAAPTAATEGTDGAARSTDPHGDGAARSTDTHGVGGAAPTATPGGTVRAAPTATPGGATPGGTVRAAPTAAFGGAVSAAPSGDINGGPGSGGGESTSSGGSRAGAAVVDWSPGDFTDEDLEHRIGRRMLGVARRALRAGYHARVRRPSAADTAPRVDLGSATVRFLVPNDLGFVHSDAVAGSRDDVIALAVWAFRAADAQDRHGPDLRVDVGVPKPQTPPPGTEHPDPAPAGSTVPSTEPGIPAAGLTVPSSGQAGAGDGRAAGKVPARGWEAAADAAVRLADDVLLAGAVHAGNGMAAAFAEVRRRLERGGLRWPLLAVGELAEQLEAYRDRGSTYAPEQVAALIAELHARRRAAGRLGGGARGRVLGSEEAAETPLRRVRLDGLGCRVVAVGPEAAGDERRVVEVYLAHPDTATVLVLRRAWPGGETGNALAQRRLAGVTVARLAGGNLVTESAVRSASRAVRLATSRIAKTTVTPSSGAWGGLPAGLLVRDLKALAAELDGLPPRVVRPRVAAELVRVVEIAAVPRVRYAPGAQRLDAEVTDAAGTTATITATHSAAAPGRLDAIAAALSEMSRPSAEGVTNPEQIGQGAAGYVSGVVRKSGGGIVIEPLAFAAGGEIVLPDLAPAGRETLTPDWGGGGDPLRAALERAVAVLAEVPHRGLRHLPPTFDGRLARVCDDLAGAGLRRAAEAVAAFRQGGDPGRWADAYLRLMVTVELL